MITLWTDARNAATNAIAAALSSAGTPPQLKIYTAGRAQLLAIATCPKKPFTPAVNGSANLTAPINSVPILATGIAAMFELCDGAENVYLTGEAGPTGDLILDQNEWSEGDLVDIANFTITTPARTH